MGSCRVVAESFHTARSTAFPQPEPGAVFDGPVPGPWGRYADVWRVVYAPPSDRFLGADENYFLW